MVDRTLPEEPLFTPSEAAAKLNICQKTMMEHVRAGRLRYINVGSGSVRKRYRFTTYNLQTFIENQKVRETQRCPSTSQQNPHSTPTTFKSTVVAFTALQKPGAKKRL